MIMKDEITMYMVCTVFEGNANIHLVMNSFGTLFRDKIFFPDISLPCFKFLDKLTFPDKWSPCEHGV